MKLELSAWTVSQERQMLSKAPVAPLESGAASKLTLTTKYGVALGEQIADAVQRENAVLIVNLAADAPQAPFNAYLVNQHADKLKAAMETLAQAMNATEILCYATRETAWELPGVKTLIGERSLVLREESALYHRMETGELRSCPLERTYPTQGYQGRPTIVVDGEILCQIYAALQSDYVPSKLVAIGDGAQVFLAEAKIGATLGELIREIGLVPGKAALVGGILGKFVTPEGLETPIENTLFYDSVFIYPNTYCMADLAMQIATAAQCESCGKCVLCREGAWQIQTIFRDICDGKAKREDLATVLDIGSLIRVGAFCSFGRKMINPALAAVELYKAELEDHLVKKTCPAGVCQAFAKYVIDPKLCNGCTECLDDCDEDAISGKKGFIHVIDPQLCTGCGRCAVNCEQQAILRGTGKLKVPKKPTKVGMFK